MKKKVLMTASVYTHIGHFHLPYLRRFRELGWETHIACSGLPAETDGCDRAFEIPFEKNMGSLSNFRAAAMLRRIVREERYDLVITHTSLASFFTRLAVKGLRKRPAVVNVVHGYLFDDDTRAGRRLLLLGAEKLTAGVTDLLLTMNRWDYEEAAARRLGRRVLQIPGMGVDFRRFEDTAPEAREKLRGQLGIPADAVVLFFAGEFSARKSQQVLIRALGLLPETCCLVLAGTGDLLPRCREDAESLGLSSRVFFPGYVRELPAWYRMADIAVSASRSEGLPFNVMEAMYMGLPVVASAVKGHADLVAEGETGFLYPYGDAEACAACVRRLAADAAMREAFGKRARLRAGTYDLETVLPKVMEAYLSAVPGAPDPAGSDRNGKIT